jgi:ankyrin repeat protein
VNRKGGPYGWDPLTYLCFSRFLKLEKDETDGFARTAEILLDAGANPNSGFYSDEHLPNPVWESVMYGAAGVAHDPRVTKILLDHGADPNDDETPYHSPEWFDNRAMHVIVESGKANDQTMVTMLHRKLDWTDLESVTWLLEKGANPNAVSPWKQTALEHSIQRDNRIAFIETLLDHGADPTIGASDANAFIHAAATGRGDALTLFRQRGFDMHLDDDLQFLEACALGDRERAITLVTEAPAIATHIEEKYPDVLLNYAGSGNTEGVRLLLDIGFAIEPENPGASRNPTPLQLAVWRERKDTAQLLLDRGADPRVRNARGKNAIDIAELAQTEMSEWTPHGSKEILDMLRAHISGT